MLKKIAKNIHEAKERDEQVIVIGGLNTKIGDKIRGNKSEVSRYGKNCWTN